MKTLASYILAFTLATVAMATSVSAQIPCLSGIVTDPAGNPVVGGDLDFDISATGQRIVTPGDNTDQFGLYSVCVLPNTYDVSFAPAPGTVTRLIGRIFPGIQLTQSIEMNVTLDTGIILSGVVSDSLGNPIGNVDLDIDTLSGGRVYTPYDVSSIVDGSYSSASPKGVFAVKFDPPPGSPWRGVRFDTVSLFSDTTINVTLSRGVRVSGFIRTALGAGAPDVKISSVDIVTSVKRYVSNNKTDSSGFYSVVLPPGIQKLRFSPPPGSPLLGVVLDSLTLGADTTITLTLADANLLNITVLDTAGSPIVESNIDVTDEVTRLRLFTPNDLTDLQGRATLAVPDGVYEIKVDPPPGTILDRDVLRNVPINSDTSITVSLKVRSVVIKGRVVDEFGSGASGVIVGARDSTGGELPVKFRTTDATGTFLSKIPVVSSVITFSAPPVTGLKLAPTSVSFPALALDTLALGVITLMRGVEVSLNAFNANLSPAQNANIFFSAGGVDALLIPDTTSRTGQLRMIVVPGIYTVGIQRPGGVRDTLLSAVTIETDTSLTLTVGSGVTPADFALMQNYPNPFNGMTRIPYSLSRPSQVRVAVYNILGQTVRTYDRGRQPAGYYEILWDAANDNNHSVASGVYLYKLQTDFGSAVRQIVLLR